jgi:serine protease Do
MRVASVSLVAAVLTGLPLVAASGSEPRRTPIVAAVDRAKAAIVNIHGEKMLPVDEVRAGQPETLRRVNGMGTGVIIDERGYIVTNHHVVDGVPKINVTLSDETSYVGRMLSFDATTDLAIIKIDAKHDLPTIPVGISSDLMLGETVIAVGNAYGYTHTVTHGIISALHRSVQVSDAQGYDDLIQTDAAINPGNSGGPLLNIDGEMIGLNVAVRAGAQLIGFAIPVDKAMEIATELMSTRRITGTWHGVVVKHQEAGVVVASVDDASPAASVGLKAGDVIKSVGGQKLARPLDLERTLVDRKAGDEVPLAVERDGRALPMLLVLKQLPDAWEMLGLKLQPVPERQFSQLGTRYRGGLTVTAVRPESPAARQGIRRGDILVGMHKWETTSLEHVTYVLNRPDFAKLEPLKFYIVRGSETFSGNLTLAQRRVP